METTHCDMCGSTDATAFLERKDRYGNESFTYVKCENCGLIFLNPRPTQSEIIDYYPEDYDSYQECSWNSSPDKSWHTSRSLKRQLEFVQKHIATSGTLLDIGCGTGIFMRFAETHGWNVKGLEPVESAARIARERLHLDVVNGSFETSDIPDNFFDLITMWDVLEHLTSPRNALSFCYRKLKPRGLVIFSIPNLRSFDRYLFKARWIGWDAPRHLILLDSESVEKLVEITGFELITSKCITGAKGTFFLNLDELWGKDRNKSFDHILSLIFWLYRKISYLTQRGPVITYAIRKLH